MKFLLISISIVTCTLTFSQNELPGGNQKGNPHLDTLHPKFYLFGEIHIDNLEYMYKKESIEPLERDAMALYDSILSDLFYNKMVRKYILEAPLSLQYNFNKYINTGDSSWVAPVWEFKMVRSELKILRKFYQEDPNVYIYCVDREYDETNLINTLFYLTFYEPFKKSEINYIFSSSTQNFDFFDSVYYNKLSFDPVLLKFIDQLWDLKTWSKRNNSESINYLWDQISTNLDVQRELESLLGDTFPYFKRLLSSHHTFQNIKMKSQSGIETREIFLANNIIEIYGKSHDLAGFFGISHLVPNESIATPMILNIIDKGYCNKVSILYFADFESSYPKGLKIRNCEFSKCQDTINITFNTNEVIKMNVIIHQM